MDKNTHVSRRTFVAGAAAAGATVAGASLLTACGGGSGSGGTAGGGGAAGTPKILQYYISEPAFIDPYNLQESEGTQVGAELFDSLLDYDYRTAALKPAAAAKWEVSDDATIFTFHLVEGATFHNGDPVTAADFKRGWERICSTTTSDANGGPSEISYHLAMVKGYDEFQAGTATELVGAEAVDDKTFKVTLSAPYADFIYVITHPALAPVPKAAVDDWATFSASPIGNGPFKMDGKWEHDQYIRVKRFDQYHGGPAIIDGVDYKIIDKVETAFTEFEAGNFDFVQIPSGQIKSSQDKYGVSPDGYTANPGQQTLGGLQSAVYYLIINCADPVMKDKNVRLALNYAVDRQAICDSVFEGTRDPATGIIPPGIDGFRASAWPAAVYDVEKAKAALAAAGFADGKGFPTIKLSFNSGAGHDDIMAIVQQNLANIGITAEFDTLEWAAYLDALAAGTFQIGRLGWISDYPIMENSLFSLFYTGNGDNYSQYSNPEVDKKIMAARGITDNAARIKALQEADDLIAADVPIIPMMVYKHVRVCSKRVKDFYFSPNMIADMQKTDLV